MRIAHLSAALGLAATAVLAPVGAASASPVHPAHPDTACMQAGIATLRSLGLLDDVARGGLPISLAVAAGVTPRAGTDVSSLPDPLPLSLVLADHRAGQHSLFLYPWCS